MPDGFVITTAAYRRVVAANNLQARITAAASEPDAEATSRELFDHASIPDEVLEAITTPYRALGSEEARVAVRSSATAEDLADLSFAGQQDTFLNVNGERALVDAVRRCWASLFTTRAITYRSRAGINSETVSLAVVVQVMVQADASGVLFTVDPVSGDARQLTINATWGLGESLVSGAVTPDIVVVDRNTNAILRQTIGDKTRMTVATELGTVEQPVAAEQQHKAVLTPELTRELVALGLRVEALYAQPMDLEWALSGGQIALLQARPITTSPTEEWNDSRLGDLLWTSANLGEAVPDVMTPATWSLIQRFIYGAMQANFTAGYSPVGNIGGRLYMNLSLTATQASIIFMSRTKLVSLLEQTFGQIPDDVEIPLVHVPRWRMLRELLPAALHLQVRVRDNLRRFDAFVSAAPSRVEAVLRHIEATATPPELRRLWYAELGPLFDEACAMLEAATRRDSGALLRTRGAIANVVGEADADLLLTGSTGAGGQLASLEPLLGLEQVARGELSREAYARRYGHRGPHEFEVSLPRPAEDVDWIDRQLEGVRAAPVDASGLLARRQTATAAAWQRLAQRTPKQARSVRKQVARARRAYQAREAARSEVVRVFWPLRTFYVRAGALLDRAENVFFLPIDELLRVLGGERGPLSRVASRHTAYSRYAALPAYPVLIRGAFDPFTWAADPHRRTDFYSATASAAQTTSDATISGLPGAPGIAEGTARVLESPEAAESLEPGEILVTSVTNVGWTPLFPRAAAIVTDVGAPLSHAAIVARELGIPAVVGTGSATRRLHTGDHVRVDGGRGRVERLST